MLSTLGVYQHDHRPDLLVAVTDEGTLILPPGVKATPCGLCGNDAYVMVSPPWSHFEFVQPSAICGQGCLDRFKALLRLDDEPTDERP